MSRSWTDPDPEIGKNPNRWKLACIKCLLRLLGYHVPIFQALSHIIVKLLSLPGTRKLRPWVA